MRKKLSQDEYGILSLLLKVFLEDYKKVEDEEKLGSIIDKEVSSLRYKLPLLNHAELL